MNKLLVLALLAFAITSNVKAQEIKVTLGIGTPIFNQDIFSSRGKIWKTGDVVGSLIIMLPTKHVDYSFVHGSLFLDTKDVGVSAIFVSKTFTFNL